MLCYLFTQRLHPILRSKDFSFTQTVSFCLSYHLSGRFADLHVHIKISHVPYLKVPWVCTREWICYT